MERIVVTRPLQGIAHMQVCVEKDVEDAELLAFCNATHPSGTENGWTSVIREGEGGPVECASDPDRLHLLVGC